jgi:hypothetical protein
MLGVLSYTINIAIHPMITQGFAPQSILGGLVRALVATLPIALVMGPLFVVCIMHLKQSRKL